MPVLLGYSDMEEPKHDYRKYLEPKVLARIGSLELRARMIVEGFYMGMHHTPHHGSSVEFADHRAYSQGDDLRHIDWKVFGKTDKYYIKEYEQETSLDLMLFVDASESMDYRSNEAGLSKFEYATATAAAIAYLTLQQQDSVGLIMFDEELRQLIKPSNASRQWQTLVKELTGNVGGAKTSMGAVLHALAERLVRRTLIILIGDLFDDADAILKGFRHLRYRRHELIVWNIWDPAELSLPFKGPILFEGLESSGRLLTDPRSLRARYLDEVDRFQTRLRAGCGHMQIDFTVFNSAETLDTVLGTYLATRNARLRRRSSRVHGGT